MHPVYDLIFVKNDGCMLREVINIIIINCRKFQVSLATNPCNFRQKIVYIFDVLQNVRTNYIIELLVLEWKRPSFIIDNLARIIQGRCVSPLTFSLIWVDENFFK